MPDHDTQTNDNASVSGNSGSGTGAWAQAFMAPSISLPKGGGAVRGIGEKFAANPVTGTGSTTIPIATSPGRSGMGPDLSLSYDSGSGNSPFGFGWSLGLPSISRKTDKGLPQYRDEEDSDTFILSGMEDLVPCLKRQGADAWVADDDPHVISGDPRPLGQFSYHICCYRPRIEGLFARIERWTRSDGDVHWRSLTKDNVLNLYGFDENSRIADPDDPHRIFTWLICETRDDKGNGVIYEYHPDDGSGIALTLSHEINRGELDDPRRKVNRYPKRIRYGNRAPLLDDDGRRPALLTDGQLADAQWLFEVVFDYGEGYIKNEVTDAHGVTLVEVDHEPAGTWSLRPDPFSTCRPGFEVRTTRLCQRVLMFHHFDGDPDVGLNCLVRSTDFTYRHEQDPAHARQPVYTFIQEVTQCGYARQGGRYLKCSLPPVSFTYSQPVVRSVVEEIDAESLENLPSGLDGAGVYWTDLHGESIPGALAEAAGAWFYKRNLSPISERPVEFAPIERVAIKPDIGLTGGAAQFLDLAGDGLPDLVVLDGPMPGLYEHDDEEGWSTFRPFRSRITTETRNPNVRLIDLDGDGHADVLISEDEAFVWHPSLAEDGFGPARRLPQALDDERGPRLVFAESTQTIHLADLNGDGLTDLVRIRNGQVCYWPNLGYGRFGSRIEMDHAPLFDRPERFEARRLRLADIDGSGTTDLIYLHADGVHLYFNQSGNSWSDPEILEVFPRVDNIASIQPIDLKGNGTACLVWSSTLPGDTGRQVRYVDLMGGQKPHLLASMSNNLGAETRVGYASSTKFYLQDRRDGRPWMTRLPFPVHVVERVETRDLVSRNLFATTYAYHHGYFDAVEREFRGFGMVEQRDTEAFAALSGDNIDAASYVPPVLTRTWVHTGAYLQEDRVSSQFERDYFRDPALDNDQAQALLLPDTTLPADLSADEEREACRALKGSMLRQEVYALDGSDVETVPYTVVEQNFAIRTLQPRAGNRNAVFFTHPLESITYQYERQANDPRVQHRLTLEVDAFGNVRKELVVGYGRRQASVTLTEQSDKEKQTRARLTYTESDVTGAVNRPERPDDYRTPLPGETRTYELTGYLPTGRGARFQASDVYDGDKLILKREIEYEKAPSAGKERRMIECVRTYYRPDDLGEAGNDPLALLPLLALEPCAIPGESYKLAFTPGLVTQVFRRDGEDLIPDQAAMLGGTGADEGGFRDLDGDGRWWMPSGRSFLSPSTNDSAGQELTFARQHFFRAHRFRNAFGAQSIARFDADVLLLVETVDVVGNRVTVGERLANGEIDPDVPGNDYRVLQPRSLTDQNGNRTKAMFDALGLVAGTAVMGKRPPAPVEGDSLADFEADLSQSQIDVLRDAENPRVPAEALLHDATTRIVYDLDRFRRSREANPDDPARWEPVYAATIAREQHASDPAPDGTVKVQINFSYADGFGREIQKKIQAEPGPVPELGQLIDPRWVGSGWTVYNNKGKPVRQYEPFFSRLAVKRHRFEFGAQYGVSPMLFYDPLDRVVATLHPNHTYEKVVFDAWQQTTFDVNDTVEMAPSDDEDVKWFLLNRDETPRLPEDAYRPTWHALRTDPAYAAKAALRWPDLRQRTAETRAANDAARHAGTPTTTHLDALGRPFLSIADNGSDPDHPGQKLLYAMRTDLDIEGNQRAVRDAVVHNGDALGRIVMRYDYDLLGNVVHQGSMEAGERWLLADVTGKPIRSWDQRGHTTRMSYDKMRRPIRIHVSNADPTQPEQTMLTERLVYGEQHPDAVQHNLRGTLYLHLDQAGAVLNEHRDYKGNLVRATRRLTDGTQYRQTVNWSTIDADHAAMPEATSTPFDQPALDAALDARLDAETFPSVTAFDALNRPVHQIMPDGSVIRPAYHAANLLERVDVNLHGEQANGQPVWTAFLANINYDAKGQRTRIDYATRNGRLISTAYQYDDETFRLVHSYTRRGVDPATRNGVAFTDDCENPAPPPPTIAAPETPPSGKSCGLQNLHYAYDPIGNITTIRDDAQQTIYFRNKRVEPSADYTYDALYRLILATGREHLGQVSSVPIPHAYDDALRVNLEHPGNGKAMGRYTEDYVYDAVGNLLSMQHTGTDPANPGWTRTYAYNESSLIENGAGGTSLKQNNRLSQTTVGQNNNVTIERYVYDAHGNMVRMPHLGGAHPDPNMFWDYRDQLQSAEIDGAGTVYYVYDAGGQRVRKVWEKAPGTIEERIYLGGYELFRRRNGGGAVGLERQTLHVMDDTQRVALVETRTIGNDPAPEKVVRYQFGNHLGSASLELDSDADIISYEEYSPYGSTTYQAVRSQTETPKRYRYTGKERDEESGLFYHGARYYAPWLGRWTACDPAGIDADPALYNYVQNRPVAALDPSGGWPEWVDKKVEGAKETVRAAMSSAHAVVEGAIWNPTVAGQITRAERSVIDFARGKTLEKLLGNVKGLPGALGPTAKNADRALRTTVEQIKTTYAQNVARVVRGATKDAAKFIAENVAHAGKEARAVLNLPTGTPRSVITAAENAVTPIQGSVAAPKVTVGLPGPVGTALKILAPVGAVLSAASLPEDIQKGDFGAALSDAAGFAAGSMETAAMALSYVGGTGAAGTGAAGAGTSTALIGTGGTAGAGLATGGAVVGAFALGAAVGVGLEKSLNVSDYSSEAGVYVYEKLSAAGLNDTASYVIGGAASVLAIPSAIGYAAAAKIDKWLK